MDPPPVFIVILFPARFAGTLPLAILWRRCEVLRRTWSCTRRRCWGRYLGRALEGGVSGGSVVGVLESNDVLDGAEHIPISVRDLVSLVLVWPFAPAPVLVHLLTPEPLCVLISAPLPPPLQCCLWPGARSLHTLGGLRTVPRQRGADGPMVSELYPEVGTPARRVYGMCIPAQTCSA